MAISADKLTRTSRYWHRHETYEPGWHPSGVRYRVDEPATGGAAPLNRRLMAVTPPGSLHELHAIPTGGIAALNPRLMAGKPSACGLRDDARGGARVR